VQVLAELSRRPLGFLSTRALADEAGLPPTATGRAVERLSEQKLAKEFDVAGVIAPQATRQALLHFDPPAIARALGTCEITDSPRGLLVGVGAVEITVGYLVDCDGDGRRSADLADV